MMSSEAGTATGGCLCGRVRYCLTASPRFTALCHCKHCQRQSGTAFSIVVGVPRGALRLEGDVMHYRDAGDSGHPVHRAFCPACGSPIFSTTHGEPDLIYLKAGTLDVTDDLKPTIELYPKSAQRWVPRVITKR